MVLKEYKSSGPWISEHPGIAKVSLTGSVAAGKAVMRSVSSTLKRITLELGGNDPVIICEDVDPVAIAPYVSSVAKFITSRR